MTKLLRRGLLTLAVLALVLPPSSISARQVAAENTNDIAKSNDVEALDKSPANIEATTEPEVVQLDKIDVEITTKIDNSSTMLSAEKSLSIEKIVEKVETNMSAESSDVSPPKLLISKVKTDGSGAQEFIELYNPNNFEVSLSGWQLQFLKSDATVTLLEFADDAKVSPTGFYVISHGLYDVAADAKFDIKNKDGSYTKSGALLVDGTVRLVAPDGESTDVVGWYKSVRANVTHFEGEPVRDEAPKTLQRCQMMGGAVVDSDNNLVDFKIYTDENNVEVMEFGHFVQCSSSEEPEDPEPTDPSEILNRCEGLKLNEIGANLANGQQFIEIKNTSGATVDLKGCKLATNRSKTKFYEIGNIELDSGDVLLVKIVDTELTLTKTTKGTVFLLSEAKLEIDAVNYENLPSETSWSLVEGGWVTTYKITPGEANEYQRWAQCQVGYWRNEETGRCNKNVEPAVLLDCGEGRERNPATGRCRNIPTAASLAPCKEGQYRSEETGRCRSIALAAKALQPCKDDEFRNPATNRCKKIASTDDLKECAEGFERNPATNRCRKILTANAPAAPFAPEKVKQTAQGMLGWWALGGVSLVALSYAGWQWRAEAGRLIRRIGQAFSSRTKA